MDSAKICGFAILGALLCVLIRQTRAEFAFPTKLACVTVLFLVILGLADPALSYLRDLMGDKLPGAYASLLLKALGIAFMTQIASDLCRECGEGTIAAAVDTAGKFEIVLLSLPLFSEIIGMSGELLTV